MNKYLLIACLMMLAAAVVVEAQGCGSFTNHPTDLTKYVETVNGFGHIRDCAPGTKYNSQTCSCSDLSPGTRGNAGGQQRMMQQQYMPYRRQPFFGFNLRDLLLMEHLDFGF